MKIDIAIVNYRGAVDTLQALARLAPWTHGSIWVIDNSAHEADVAGETAALRRGTDAEVRFTPAHSQSLIGPGVGRKSAWIELATPLSQPRDVMYARVEAILRAYGGRPHLGKKTTFTHHELLDVYGERFTAFQAVRTRVDPTGKLLNPFARRLFGA